MIGWGAIFPTFDAAKVEAEDSCVVSKCAST